MKNFISSSVCLFLLAVQAASATTCPDEAIQLALNSKSNSLSAALKNGLDPNCVSQKQMPLLVVSTTWRIDLETIKVLVEGGANPNAASLKGVAAIHRAANLDAPDTIAYLLSKGANVDAITKQGNTALNIAAFSAENALSVLLNAKANPNTVSAIQDQFCTPFGSYFSDTPLISSIASLSFRSGQCSLTPNKDHQARTFRIVHALLLAGANPNIATQTTAGVKITPLKLAQSFGATEIVNELLIHGANP